MEEENKNNKESRGERERKKGRMVRGEKRKKKGEQEKEQHKGGLLCVLQCVLSRDKKMCIFLVDDRERIFLFRREKSERLDYGYL